MNPGRPARREALDIEDLATDDETPSALVRRDDLAAAGRRTLESISRTRAIDLWILFPLMGANRMLTKDGDTPATWKLRLNLLYGNDEWYDQVYGRKLERTLWGEEEQRVKSRVGVIGEVFNKRLGTIFPGVASNPRILRNSTRSPLYMLCFAASNPKGARVALRIAQHLLKEPET